MRYELALILILFLAKITNCADMTWYIFNETEKGPMLLASTTNSAVYVIRGFISAHDGPLNPSLSLTAAAKRYWDQDRFAFAHLDKNTLKQKWLLSTGRFENHTRMVPEVTHRHIGGMSYDTDHLWLLLWESKEPMWQSNWPSTNGIFRVVGFDLLTGNRQTDKLIPYEASNKDMWKCLTKIHQEKGISPTADYLSDTYFFRTNDVLIILGRTNTIDSLIGK